MEENGVVSARCTGKKPVEGKVIVRSYELDSRFHGNDKQRVKTF